MQKQQTAHGQKDCAGPQKEERTDRRTQPVAVGGVVQNPSQQKIGRRQQDETIPHKDGQDESIEVTVIAFANASSCPLIIDIRIQNIKKK